MVSNTKSKWEINEYDFILEKIEIEIDKMS